MTQVEHLVEELIRGSRIKLTITYWQEVRRLLTEAASRRGVGWLETKTRPPCREDGTKEEGLVWTWTNPDGPTAQKKAYNSTLWSEVVSYPDVYPLWTPILEIETLTRPYA